MRYLQSASLKTIVVLIVLFACFSWNTAVSAQNSYPQATDQYVNDYVDVISATDEAQIRSLLAAYEAESGVQITVLTMRSWVDYNTNDNNMAQFATNLFNSWGIGDATRNNGILFLVGIDDRELRIELGSGYGAEYYGRMQRIVDQIIIPHFRQQNFSLGIHEGARAILADVKGEVYESLAETAGSSTSPSSTVIETSTRTPPISGQIRSILLGLGAVGVPLGGVLLSRFRRYRTRQCVQCQHEMARLDEQADNAYLDKGQIMEEVLSSVDYDVWHCNNCQNHEVIAYRNWFRQFKRCSNCYYRTARTTSSVVQSATYSSTGLRQHRTYCNHCRHEEVTESVIPILEESDSSSSTSWSNSSTRSSSSSSFGGGSSSGGGAGGKW